MKLLIITQAIDDNDPVLGFMTGWIAEFAGHCEEVTAVGLSVGEHHLPANVRVLSLGKETGPSRLKYLWNFFRYIIRERQHYDAVFVHMNPEYVVLGGVLWKVMGKKIGLWYAHGHVSWTLRIAERGADAIFTSTQSGFRLPARGPVYVQTRTGRRTQAGLPSQKLRIVGQGIDLARFPLCERRHNANEPFRVVVVGRLSPVKDYETLLRAIGRLSNEHVALDIVGGTALPEQREYEEALRALAGELGIAERVRFCGALPNNMLGGVLGEAHCFANTSHTGSFDKAVGEAMASGLPVLTSNEAFTEVLGEHAQELMFPPGDDAALSERITWLMQLGDEKRGQLGRNLHDLIEKNHSLSNFARKILACYK